MGSTNPQIKNFISIAYDFRFSKTDKNLIQLQRHLQILSLVNDLHTFEPTSVVTLEFYTCLEQFLSPSEASSPIAWKVITLLAHICQSKAVCSALRDDIKIVPVLSDYFLNTKLNKDKSLKTLNLIEKLSYRLKIVRTEAWVLKLVPQLVGFITNGNMGDDILMPAMKTLTNLCRANQPVLQCLHSSRNKTLLAKLTDMRTATVNIRLLATELMFYMKSLLTIVDAELTQYVLDTVFTAATDGLTESNISLLQHATDIFGELSSYPSIEDHLKGYEKYGACAEHLLSGLVLETSDPLAEAIMDLLCYLLDLELAQLHPLYEDIFSKVLTWLPSEYCGVAAVRVIQSLVNSTNGTISSAHIDDIITAIRASLTPEESLTSVGQLNHITMILTMLESLCQKDAALHLKLALDIHPSAFSSLLNEVMNMDAASCPPAVGSSISSYDNEIIHSSKPLLTSQRGHPNISILSVNDIKASIGEVVSHTVVMILSVVKLLGSHNAEFVLEYSQILNNQLVMVHLVRCQRSSSTDFVARSITLMSGGTIPSVSLNELIKASEDANSSTGMNMNMPDSSKRVPGQHILPQMFSAGCEENIDKMISRLGGTVVKMELKDCALTDVMEMYEYKLAAMVHVESALQDALSASDAMNSHTHRFLLQTRVQNDRLRALLCSHEERLQEVQREKADVQAGISQIKESARQLRENFRTEKTAIERQKTELKREVSSLKDSLDTRDEKISKLQRQLGEANQEAKSLHKQIKEEQERGQKSLEQNQKLEEELKRGRRECDDLQKDNQRVEKEKAQLRDEIKELEMLVRSHEESMSAKETELEEVTKKFSELKRIQDMIHNISSGRIGNFYDSNK